MHPKDPRLILFNYVHFVISAVLRRYLSRLLNTHSTLDTALLRIEIRSHVLTSIGKFISKTSFEAFIQMIIWRVPRKGTLTFTLIHDFTDEYTIYSNTSSTTKVHDTRICVAFLEEEMFKVFVYEVTFYLVHSFINAF